MPYGKETVPCETFDFEEISGKPNAKRMLFGSPAYFASLLIGEAFMSYGWKLTPGMVQDISNLPVYAYEDDGESKAFPCAEIELTEETAEALMDEGFMPLAAIRNSDVVRLVRFQSVAAIPAALPGRWQ
jgi:predicted component of type VI protein secretion system